MNTPPNRRALLAAGLSTALGPLSGLSALARPRVDTAMLVTALSAGTTLDLLARQAAQALQASGTDYDVLNLPGGGGLPAVQRVLQSAQADPTLLLAHAGLMCITPQLLRNESRFDPLADFTPLAILTRAPLMLYTSTAQGIDDIGDLATLRARLDGSEASLSYAILALYGGEHLAGTGLFRRLGLHATAVAYKQASQALLDVASGRVLLGISAWGNLQPLLRQGRLRVICTFAHRRLPFAPEVPAMDEAGLSDCAYEGWHGLFHRASAPASAFASQTRAIADWCARPAYPVALGELGYTPYPLPPAQAASFVQQEITHHQALLKAVQLD